MTVTCIHRPLADPPGTRCVECGARGLIQRCGVCARDLCPACYGLWVGLACSACRKEGAVTYDLDRLCETVGLPPTEVAARLHWSGSTTLSAHLHGLDAYRADQAAVAFGYHPALVWPEWLELAAAGRG